MCMGRALVKGCVLRRWCSFPDSVGMQRQQPKREPCVNSFFSIFLDALQMKKIENIR